MNKRDQAIIEWVKNNRPDILTSIQDGLKKEAVILLTSIAFEAGRQFQHDNNDAEMDNPAIYLQ